MGTVVKRSEAIGSAGGHADVKSYPAASAGGYETSVVTRSEAIYGNKLPSYINRFLDSANSFFQAVDRDTNEKNRFNAAEFFADRQKQADSLKNQADIAGQYLDQYGDYFDKKEYDYLRDYLSNFNTNVDDVLALYQPSVEANSGLQNYQNEYATYLEEQDRKGQKMHIAADMLGDHPLAGFFGMMGDAIARPDPRGVTDQWTDEQRYILGSLQNEDPIEAMKYARNINRGQDPNQIAAVNEQQEQELLALDLDAAKRELEKLEREYWSYSYDASTPMGERAGQQELQRMEREIDEKQRVINQAQLIQDRKRLGSVSGNADFAANSLYQKGNTDPVYAYINNVDGVRGYMDRAHNPAIKGAYDQMTADEVANYNYHYATGGQEQAQRYLDTISETLNQRKAGQMYQSVKGNTAQQMLFAAGAGLNQSAEGFRNLLNFGDDYIAPSAYQIASGMVREELAGTGMQLPEFLGGGSMGQVGYDLINTAANMAPSMAIGALNPIAGTLTMGASAAGGAYQEALNQGYSKKQARTYSALVGASEAGLEHLLGGISSLGGVIPGGIVEKMLDGVDNAFKRFAIEMGGSMIGEGFEEGLQEVLTPYFQNLALGANEDVNWNEVAYSALLGALSGGVMEAPGTAINAATYSLRNRPSTGSSSSGSAPSTPALTERDIQSKVAQDGKDRIISSNESVDALDFDSIANGEATIQLSDGRTAPMDDMNWADQNKAARFMVVRSLPGIETEAANDLYHAMTDNNSGSDIDTVVGIRDAYGLGYNGFDKTDASRYGRDSAKLSPALRTAAFEAGRKQMEADAAATPKLSQTSVNKIQDKSVKPADGYKKVVFEGKVKLKDNPKAKAEVRFMDYIAEKFSGTTVHVYQSYKGKDGKYYYRDVYGNRKEAPNGKYVGDEIWIDLNSGDTGEGLVLNTFAHEMYHHVEKWNKKGAQKLAGFVVKELGLKDVESAVDAQIKKAEAAGYGVEYFMKNGNNGKGMTREQAINMVQQRAMSDFVADSLETMFSRGDAAETITRLKEEDRGLFDKIKEFIDEWVSTLKQWYSDKTISKEGKMVAQLERFEELQKLFLEAVAEAGANYNVAVQRGEQKNTTPESDAMLSERNSVPEHKKPITIADVKNIRGIGRKSINSFTSKDLEIAQKWAHIYFSDLKAKSPFFRAWFGDWRTNDNNPVEVSRIPQYEDSNEARKKNRGTVQNVDTKWDIRISREGETNTISHSGKGRLSEYGLAGIQSLIRNAVLLDSEVHDHHSNNAKDDRISFDHKLYSLGMSKNGSIALYRITVEETFQDPKHPQDKRFHNLKYIEKVADRIGSLTQEKNLGAESTNDASTTVFSVADVVYFVNQFDKEYTSPPIASKVVNTDGTPKVMYHGSPAQFSRFDRKKAKSSGLYGRGFYFTDSDSHAKTYGNTYSVYLNIRNPLKSGNTTVTRQQVRSYLEAVAENEDYSIENYGTYDVDSILNTVMGKDGKADAFKVIQDINATAIGDMVEAAELFNNINGTTFDGIVVPTETVAFRPEQIKSATDNIGTFDGQNDDIYHSLRNAPEDIHTVRQGLAGTFDELVKTNPNMKRYADEYRQKAAEVQVAEGNLKSVRQQIQELSKSRNPKDQKQLKTLRAEAISLHNRVNNLNKRLMRIEGYKLFSDAAKDASKSYKNAMLQQMKNQQAENIQQQLIENRVVREELTGKDSDITIMEKEFIRIVKKYEQLDTKTGKKIADLRNALKSEADSHREESRVWQMEFNRLLREYETSGRKIERLEATIARQRATAKARVQSRRNTEMRNKIQRRASELDRMLRNGTKTSYVPEGLREPVAAILEAIDLRKSDKETKVAQHLRDLRLAYYDIRSNSDPNIRSIFDEGLSDHLETLTKEVGDTKLGDMTTYQLEAVYDILTAVLETVRNANEAFAESKKAKISEMSDAAMRQIRSAGKEKYRGKMDSDFVKGLKAFMWNDMRPVDIFEAIGSSEMMNIFRNIRKGEDVWAKDIQEARDFFRQQWKKNKGDDWDMTQQHTFTSASGMDFRLSPDQIMSIYALFRRDKEQAMSHLRQGGFVFDNNVVDKKGKSHTDATAYNLTDDTILNIIGTLNADQMAFVESMQGYLSDTMGAKGNEVSMKLYGIKLFREKNYFPIRSAEQYMERAKARQRGEVKIKNSGFTKPVTPNANTPIVLSSFMDVWGSHVDEMSNYHAFVLPMEDMYRVYNYRTDISNEESSSRSVQAAIQNAYGEGAVKAIDHLLKDINGGVRSDSTAGFLNKLISRYKKGATMASLSVAAQQPSAIMRAAAMIDWKYFIGPKPTPKMTGRTWDEIKKHAPIAIIKEIGGFDTNTGRVASEFLTKMEYQGFEEQFKAFFEDGQFRDDVLGRLPAWADEISWGVIWNAVKREQKSHYPNMDVTSDAFLNKVAERFTDVIIHTQVYDSVLAKNAMMRSKDTGMKMVTSFMAEPTVTANMLASAITKAVRKGDKAGAVKTVSAIVASTLFNAAASSVVYALRDDDEDERYGEKWIASFMENLLESTNPMGYIPLLRDVNNILAGYDIERSDMSIVSDFAEAVKSLGNEDMSDWEKVEKFAGAVANVFGVPLKNVTRDLKGIWNTLRTRFGAKNTATRTGYYMAATGKNMSDGEQLLLAIRRDDQKHFERVAGRFDDQKSAESALKTTIGTHYKDGSMTAEEAKELLMTYAGMEEDDVYWKLDEWNFAMDNDSSDDYAKYNSLHAAIDSGAGFEAEIDRHMEHGAEPDEIRAQISRVYHKAYLEASEDEREQIREKVAPAYLYAGMDEDALEAKFNDWDFEAEYGMTYSEYKAGYLDDSVSRVELEDAMKFYGRKNYQIADDIRSLDKDKKFRSRYDMSLSEMKDAYDDGDVSRNQLINALVFNGMTQKEASQEVTQRDIRNRLGIDYMELDDAYKHGDISRQTLYNAMIENGATRAEADEAITGYDWLKKHVKNHPDLTISDAKKFAVSLGDNAEGYTLEDFGVSIKDYKVYKQKLPDCQGVDANGDGKTDSGTKRDAILRMIDSLPISDEAKEGLALMSYSKSSIRKNAPWH